MPIARNVWQQVEEGSPASTARLLSEQAAKERRSLAQQVVVVLARGLDVELDAKARRQKVLEAIQSEAVPQAAKLGDPVKLIAEDRRQ